MFACLHFLLQYLQLIMMSQFATNLINPALLPALMHAYAIMPQKELAWQAKPKQAWLVTFGAGHQLTGQV